jgi:hypothetical protein
MFERERDKESKGRYSVSRDDRTDVEPAFLGAKPFRYGCRRIDSSLVGVLSASEPATHEEVRNCSTFLVSLEE